MLNRREIQWLIITIILIVNLSVIAQVNITPANPEYYVMDREHIRFEDSQVLLVNYRGFVSP
jgi:hypothetical protein